MSGNKVETSFFTTLYSEMLTFNALVVILYSALFIYNMHTHIYSP